MTKFACRVGATPGTIVPQLRLDNKLIRDYLMEGSKGKIDLAVDPVPALLSIPDSADDIELNVALGDLTNNSTLPGVVTTIGLLFAASYRPKNGIFGYMFDLGGPGSDFGAVPREGCAVFVEAIRPHRPGPSFEDEVTFTAIHELGHVFNLWHVDDSVNFMAPSKLDAGFSAPFGWVDAHTDFLLRLPDKHVQPGGSVFGARGGFGPSDADGENSPRDPDTFGLELSVEMSQREFRPFEPVELDIELRVASGVSRKFQVPDAVDPAYSSFEVWIEEPSEERRRYRSTKHFCTPAQTLTVSRKRPFRRDLTIFGEAGGYTFRSLGIHKVWARFRVAGHGWIVSNLLEVNVLPRERGERFELFEAILRDSSVASLLFHRSRPLRGEKRKRIDKLIETFEDAPAASAVRYAQGRAFLRHAERAKSAAAAAPHLSMARRYLTIAADDHLLSSNRRRRALEILRTLAAAN